MFEPVVNFGGYAFGPVPIAHIAALAAVAGLGLSTLMQFERSKEGVFFGGFAVGVGLWLGAGALMYGAPDPAAAENWAAVTAVTVGVLCALFYYFTVETLGLVAERRAIVMGVLVGAALLPAAVFGFDLLIAEMRPSWAGWFPRFEGLPGVGFATYCCATLGAALGEWVGAYRGANSDEIRGRAAGFLSAAAAASLAIFDLAAAFGLPLVPLSALASVAGLAFMRKTLRAFPSTEFEASPTGGSVLETMGELVFIVDERHRIRIVNRMVSNTLGWAPSELAGRSFAEVASELEGGRDLHASLVDVPVSEREVELESSDGESLTVRVSSNPLESPAGETAGAVIVANRTSSEGPSMPTTPRDSTTGLRARAAFLGGVTKRLARSDSAEEVALCLVDLNRFKVINDTHGPRVGDRVLRSVGERIRERLGERGIAGRLGGDEFGLYLDSVSERAEVEALIDEIRSAISEPFEFEEQEVYSSASVGYVVAESDDYESAEQVLQDAEVALTNAKASSRIQTVLFDSEMYERVSGRLEIEHELRRAIEQKKGIELHYQPIFSLDRDVAVGAEALARWDHPEHGSISPGEFIPVAEETGLIVPLGELLLEQVWRQVYHWDTAGILPDEFSVHFNLSATELARQRLLDKLDELSDSLPLPEGCLQFEITEYLLADSPEQTEQALKKIRQLGIGLAIDDFGTGYSSLDYLRRFDPETLKIDRQFVRDSDDDNGELEIVRSVVDLSEKLEVEVIAEGIETAEQLQRFRALGIELAQGFYWSRSLSIDEFAAEYLPALQEESVPSTEESNVPV